MVLQILKSLIKLMGLIAVVYILLASTHTIRVLIRFWLNNANLLTFGEVIVKSQLSVFVDSVRTLVNSYSLYMHDARYQFHLN